MVWRGVVFCYTVCINECKSLFPRVLCKEQGCSPITNEYVLCTFPLLHLPPIPAPFVFSFYLSQCSVGSEGARAFSFLFSPDSHRGSENSLLPLSYLFSFFASKRRNSWTLLCMHACTHKNTHKNKHIPAHRHNGYRLKDDQGLGWGFCLRLNQVNAWEQNPDGFSTTWPASLPGSIAYEAAKARDRAIGGVVSHVVCLNCFTFCTLSAFLYLRTSLWQKTDAEPLKVRFTTSKL